MHKYHIGLQCSICAISALVSCMSANADLPSYERFDYPVGTPLDGQDGGHGVWWPWTTLVAGNAQAVVQMGLGAPGQPDTGGAFGVSGDPSGMSYLLAQRTAVLPFYMDSDRWISFRLRAVEGDSLQVGMTGNPFEGSFQGSFSVKKSTSGDYRFRVGNATQPTGVMASTQFADLIVVRMSPGPFGDGTSNYSLFINPTGAGDDQIIASGTARHILNYPDLFISYASPLSGWAQSSVVDDIRLGTRFNHVVPYIPSPAGAALLAMMGFAVTRRHRH